MQFSTWIKLYNSFYSDMKLMEREENEKLSKCIEYQKSAIADLEENLKNKWEEEKWKN